MISASESIHSVKDLRAVRLYPANSNSVTIQIVADDESGGEYCKDVTLFFGQGAHAANRAQTLFYSLGGKPEDVARGAV